MKRPSLLPGRGLLPIWVFAGCLAFSFGQQSGRKSADESQEAVKQEEIENYFRKWLDEDVVYIISEDEEAVFKKLTTIEEKENFIEQFWQRRDPDPRTAENEFKAEHYRRIAYSNEKFTSGDPGWLTDRGRVYIIHGPPEEITARPDGGAYVRPLEEGGGTTSVYPYEKWRYRYIEGLGNDIELEFVDKTNTGEYKLAVFPWEKDALIHIGEGPTLAESTGLSTRKDHPYYNPGASGAMVGPEYMYMSRVNDTPFARYETYAKVQTVPIIDHKDLKELVQVNIDYTSLPFEVRKDYFKLNENQTIVPLTVSIRNENLSFKLENSVHVGRLGIYGIVTTMTNQYVLEFEHDLIASYQEADLIQGLQKTSVYQKVLTLDTKMRYKLDLVVKDLNGGSVGVTKIGLVPPPFKEDRLSTSPLVLSDHVEPLPEVPTTDEMFVLGDVRILPNVDSQFQATSPLGIYVQAYNIGLDQTSMEPAIRVIYNLYRNGELLKSAIDENGESTQFFSLQRVVLVKNLSLNGLEPGTYKIEVRIQDLLSNEEVHTESDFTVVDGSQMASLR